MCAVLIYIMYCLILTSVFCAVQYCMWKQAQDLAVKQLHYYLITNLYHVCLVDMST